MKNFLPKSNSSSKGLVLSEQSESKGFTLIELMVVISIIAFLAVIGVAAYSNAQKTARDGRRKADIDAIAQSMESNYSTVAGTYPTLAATMFASGVMPIDPSTSANYAGNTVNSAKGFWACATLEGTASTTGPGNASAAGGATGTSNYPTYSGTLSMYCRSSQQSQ